MDFEEPTDALEPSDDSAERTDRPDSESKYELDTNLVTQLKKTKKGRGALKRISKSILDDVKTTWDQTEGYRQRVAKDWDLFSGILPEKTMPFEGCANIHIPSAMENVMRLQTRMMDELFGDWTNVFGVVPVGPEDDELADVLTLHSNWQLREQITDFQRQMHRATLSFLFIGDVSGESSYDPKTKLNRHEVLTVDDVLVPYTSTTTQPNYSDCPWRARILRLYRHEIEARSDEWEDTDKLLENEPPSFDDEPNEPLAAHATESSEQQIDDAQRVKPYKLVRYEGWFDLPGEGRQRYLQAIADWDSGHLLSLKLHEQENWQDRIRHDQQMMELQAYESALALRQQTLNQLQQQHAMVQQADQAGIGGPLNNMAMQGDLEQAQAELPMPPAPEWLQESEDGQPRPVQMDPIRLGVHAVCIEPLKGNLGLSYGRIQADHNRAINTMLSQFVDSATFANVPCFVGSAGVAFNSNFEFKPGMVNVSNLTPEQLGKGLIPFPSPQPSPALFQTVEFLFGASANSMQSPNVLSGEPGKSGEPFKGLAARIEQASKGLGTFTRKFMNEFLETIVKNNAYLNSVFLPEDELVQVTNHAIGQTVPVKISRSMYARSYAIVFRADLRFTSQTERVAEADEVLKMAMTPPLLQIMQNPGFIYAALKKSLQARGLHQFVALLGAPPPPVQTFGQPPPPTQEQQAQMAAQQAQQGPPGGAPQGPPQGGNGQQMPMGGMPMQQGGQA